MSNPIPEVFCDGIVALKDFDEVEEPSSSVSENCCGMRGLGLGILSESVDSVSSFVASDVGKLKAQEISIAQTQPPIGMGEGGADEGIFVGDDDDRNYECHLCEFEDRCHVCELIFRKLENCQTCFSVRLGLTMHRKHAGVHKRNWQNGFTTLLNNIVCPLCNSAYGYKSRYYHCRRSLGNKYCPAGYTYMPHEAEISKHRSCGVCGERFVDQQKYFGHCRNQCLCHMRVLHRRHNGRTGTNMDSINVDGLQQYSEHRDMSFNKDGTKSFYDGCDSEIQFETSMA